MGTTGVMEDGASSLWGGKLDAYKFSITKPTSSIELGKFVFDNYVLVSGESIANKLSRTLQYFVVILFGYSVGDES